MDNVVKIEITRAKGKLMSIKAFMPTWQRSGYDGKIYISIPFFGIETYAISEESVDQAINEAIQCFCIAAEQVGKGLEEELEDMGWKLEKEKDHSYMDIESSSPAIDFMLNTGDPYALELELAC